MNRTTLPINEIIVIDRQRIDLGDIAELADSIIRYGLIQPIVVNQEKRLIAGGRRLAAHQYLNRSHIDVVFRETLSVDELHELELEENVRRKEMHWTERCLNIDKIHTLKKRRAALDSEKWGMRETGEMLGVAASRINYNIEIAKRLREELSLPQDKRRYWNCSNFQDAWQLRMRDEEDAIAKSLAEETVIEAQTNTGDSFDSSLDDLLAPAPEVYNAPTSKDVIHEITDADLLLRRQQEQTILADLTKRIREKGFNSLSELEAEDLFRIIPNPDSLTFQQWYEKRRNQVEPWMTIPLSKMLIHSSCIDWMIANPASVDHIITDPPYGIDMAMLNQGNDGHAFKDIDTVEAEHVVDENVSLFHTFIPAAYDTLRDNGYLIMWCDIMQWQTLYDIAINADFKVQRWPIVWLKQHRCMNQCGQFNFTKTHELAMVCRKGKPTLVNISPDAHILAAHDELKEKLGHPFVKPFAVWEHLINAVSIEGQTILEPFAGRGSGVISLLRLKRKLIACECNEQHYNALVENVKMHHYLPINPNFQFR